MWTTSMRHTDGWPPGNQVVGPGVESGRPLKDKREGERGLAMRIGRLVGKRALSIAILATMISVSCGNQLEDAHSQPEAYSDFLAYMRQFETDYDVAQTPKA